MRECHKNITPANIDYYLHCINLFSKCCDIRSTEGKAKATTETP